MTDSIVLKGVVAASTFAYVKEHHGSAAWQACLDRLNDADRIAVTAGGNVPLSAMGSFNEAFVEVVCGGSRVRAQEAFRRMGAVSAEKLLTGGGIFSIFARFVSPKAVFSRAENVMKSAYPGVTMTVQIDADESGGVITMSDMSGYSYGSQRVVGWLLRGLEIAGGRNARVTEKSWDAGKNDSREYVIEVHWEG